MEMEGLRQRKHSNSTISGEMSEKAEEDDTAENGDLRDKTQNGDEVGDELKAGSYWLTRVVFLRFLAFIYLVAFAVSYHQNKELIGDRGLTPARLYLRRVVTKKIKKRENNRLYLRRVGEEFPELTSRILHLPTILWFAGTPV